MPRAAHFAFKAANIGPDTFDAIATDGVPGHEVRATINVNVVNDPPKITCSSLIARQGQAPPDPGLRLRQGSQRRSRHDRPRRRQGRHRRAGRWRLAVRAHDRHSIAVRLVHDARVRRRLHSAIPAIVPITIITPPGRTRSTCPDDGKTLHGRELALAVRMAGTAVDPAGDPYEPIWKFGDTTPTPRLARRSRTASASQGRSQSPPRPATRPRR